MDYLEYLTYNSYAMHSNFYPFTKHLDTYSTYKIRKICVGYIKHLLKLNVKTIFFQLKH